MSTVYGAESQPDTFVFRPANQSDISDLEALENTCFSSDRISRRSFKHHIRSSVSELLIAINSEQKIMGYGLVLYHKGTRLARLYSLAVSPEARGQRLGQQILNQLEAHAADRECHYMRLEVATDNETAIALYQKQGYRAFGELQDYYDDHRDALRMQKRIRKLRDSGTQLTVPWWQQTTDFTCGPASLMMAMAALDQHHTCTIESELAIWREATTIFMTSGHGGCHPFGLAIAAANRNFHASVWVSTEQPLFVDGVRSTHKKEIMALVHSQFLQQCHEAEIDINFQAITLHEIEQHLRAGQAILILVSTYRLDGKKAPHWVLVTGMDSDCLFVHDPDLDEMHQTPMDCQQVPIAKEDFDRMSAFGSQRLRAAVVIWQEVTN